MTTVTIPEFIAGLYENEIRKVVKRITNLISTEYEVEEKVLIDLIEKNIGLKVEVIPEESESFQVIRKKREKVQKPEPEMCQARLIKDKMLMQCSRKQKCNGLCGLHDGMVKLKLGRVGDPEPILKVGGRRQII